MRLSPTLLLLAACGGSAAPPSGGVHLLVSALSNGPLAGARVLAVDPDSGAALGPAVRTDASGQAQLAVRPGRIAVRVFAGGYVSFPPPGVLAQPIAGVEGGNATVTAWLAPLGIDGGAISGTVRDARGPVSGALVWVLADGSGAFAGLSDSTGAFEVLGVPAGGAELGALRSGEAAQPLRATSPANGVTITLENATHTASGAIQYQTSQHPGIDVALADTDTLELLPGLLTRSSGGVFQFGHVPDGTYFVVPSPGSDGIVAAPGPLSTIQVGTPHTQPTVAVTDAVQLTQPSSSAGSLVPADAVAAPVLQWESYPGADTYVPEVLDGSGASLWGGIGTDGKPRYSTPAIEPFATYGEGGGAPSLTPGILYRARVWAMKDGAVLSSNEPSTGFFVVKP